MFGQTRNHRLSADCRNFLLDYLAKNGPAQSAVSNRMRTWNPQAALFLLAQFRKNGLRYTDRSDVGPFDVFRTLRHTQFRQMSFWHVPSVVVVSKARICTEVHPWACHQWSGLWRRSQEDPWCFGTEIRWFINLFAMKLVCLFDHQPSHFLYFLNDDCIFFPSIPHF